MAKPETSDRTTQNHVPDWSSEATMLAASRAEAGQTKAALDACTTFYPSWL